MARTIGALALGLGLVAAQPTAFCDDEYECEFRTPDFSQNFYDLKPLCTGATPYRTPPTSNGWYISFQVCGTTSDKCNPFGYRPTYNYGSAVQFINNDTNGQTCEDNSGASTLCTPNCEVIGVGIPAITWMDSNNPGGGVNVSYYAVPDQSQDAFECPINPVTKGPFDRTVKIMITCDASADTPVISVPYEESESTCAYVVQMRSKYGCGCAPYCSGNCGASNCPGIMCGPAGLAGQCPLFQTCAADRYGVNYCCAPDCRGRQCGDDGCGGSCGSCTGQNVECSRSQQCVRTDLSSSPAPPVLSVTKFTTSGGDVFASFLGGVLSVGVGVLGIGYFRRVRAGMSAPLLAASSDSAGV